VTYKSIETLDAHGSTPEMETEEDREVGHRGGHQERAWTRRPERCRLAARLLAYSADEGCKRTEKPRAISELPQM
jgi:hypothetical protein